MQSVSETESILAYSTISLLESHVKQWIGDAQCRLVVAYPTTGAAS